MFALSPVTMATFSAALTLAVFFKKKMTHFALGFPTVSHVPMPRFQHVPWGRATGVSRLEVPIGTHGRSS